MFITLSLIGQVKFISSNRNSLEGNSDTTMQSSMSTVPITAIYLII